MANEEDKDERSGWSTCESGLDSCGCSQGDPRAGRGAGGQVMMEVESGQSARKGPVTGERIGRTMTPQSAQVHDALHAIESTLVRPGKKDIEENIKIIYSS